MCMCVCMGVWVCGCVCGCVGVCVCVCGCVNGHRENTHFVKFDFVKLMKESYLWVSSACRLVTKVRPMDFVDVI